MNNKQIAAEQVESDIRQSEMEDAMLDLKRQDQDPPPINNYVLGKIKENCPEELWKLEQQGIDHWENNINKN